MIDCSEGLNDEPSRVSGIDNTPFIMADKSVGLPWPAEVEVLGLATKYTTHPFCLDAWRLRARAGKLYRALQSPPV